MSRFDLGKANDFGMLTMSAAASILNALAREESEWAISEGSYKGGRKTAKRVLFHVFKSKSDYQAALPRITDTGGRRKAVFPFPYVDGQTTDDLGRKGETFEVEIVFHGVHYKVGMNRLMIELNDPIPGTLEHPVRGTIRCGMTDYSIEHAADPKQAAVVRVRFTEHNFDTATFSDIQVIKTVRSALQKALAAIQAMAAAIAAIKQIVGAIVSLVNDIKQKIAEIYHFMVNLVADAASSFGLKGGDLAAILPINIGGVLSLPVRAGTTAGGVDPTAAFGGSASTNGTAGNAGLSVTTGGFVRVSNRFTTVVAPADPFANLPVELLSDVAREAIELTQLTRRAEIMRQMANEIVANCDTAIEATKTASVASVGRAAASLKSLLQAKLSVLDGCAAMADVLNSGSANGRPTIISYSVPRVMSLREAAFLNGLLPQDGTDISVLNPTLESVNYIPKGTVLKVPAFI